MHGDKWSARLWSLVLWSIANPLCKLLWLFSLCRVHFFVQVQPSRLPPCSTLTSGRSLFLLAHKGKNLSSTNIHEASVGRKRVLGRRVRTKLCAVLPDELNLILGQKREHGSQDKRPKYLPYPLALDVFDFNHNEPGFRDSSEVELNQDQTLKVAHVDHAKTENCRDPKVLSQVPTGMHQEGRFELENSASCSGSCEAQRTKESRAKTEGREPHSAAVVFMSSASSTEAKFLYCSGQHVDQISVQHVRQQPVEHRITYLQTLLIFLHCYLEDQVIDSWKKTFGELQETHTVTMC